MFLQSQSADGLLAPVSEPQWLRSVLGVILVVVGLLLLVALLARWLMARQRAKVDGY